MITLEIGKSNKVGLKVSAPESLSGFSASLSACGTVKTAATNDKGEASFVFSAGDVAKVTTDRQGEYGTLTITDSDGMVRIKALPCFRAVDEDSSSTDKDRTIFVSVPKKVNTPFSQLHNPKASVKSIQTWAIQLSNILRGFSEENADD